MLNLINYRRVVVATELLRRLELVELLLELLEELLLRKSSRVVVVILLL
jgi:hypothetical protein